MTPSTPVVGKPFAYRIILASTSPRRRELLGILGIPFTVVSPDDGAEDGSVDETPLPGEAPTALVHRLSRLKAEAVVKNLESTSSSGHHEIFNGLNIIIAADTVVVLEDNILGKPKHPAEAAQMLRLLRHHQSHHVYSGFTVAYSSSSEHRWYYITRIYQSTVRMRPYTDKEIEVYVATGSPMDKAGAYGIQDQPFAPVTRLEGCFANVMGLPIGELAMILNTIGLSLPEINSVCTQHTGASCCQTKDGVLRA